MFFNTASLRRRLILFFFTELREGRLATAKPIFTKPSSLERNKAIKTMSPEEKERPREKIFLNEVFFFKIKTLLLFFFSGFINVVISVNIGHVETRINYY